MNPFEKSELRQLGFLSKEKLPYFPDMRSLNKCTQAPGKAWMGGARPCVKLFRSKFYKSTDSMEGIVHCMGVFLKILSVT